jgi:hypothetical protein
MGKSITCNFYVNINLSNGMQMTAGAMNLKQIKGLILSEKEYQKNKGNNIINTEIFAQTQRGRNFLKNYDYAIITNDFKIEYCYIN